MVTSLDFSVALQLHLDQLFNLEGNSMCEVSGEVVSAASALSLSFIQVVLR